MDDQIVAVFCLCDDMLKALGHHEDPQCQMSDAEVMTTAIVAALRHAGNFEHARRFLKEEGYIPKMLGKSRFNRRLHRIQNLFLTLFRLLGETWKDLNSKSIYVLDSYPVASCDNYRIYRSRRYRGEDRRGYQASKRRYFYGLKIHIMVTEHGQPIEFFLTSGSYSDTRAYRLYDFDVKLAARLGSDYLGTIVKGGVEGIQIQPPAMTRKLFESFHRIGQIFGQTGRFDDALVHQLARPERLSRRMIWLLTLMNWLGLHNFYWDSQLKANGAYERRFDRPYSE